MATSSHRGTAVNTHAIRGDGPHLSRRRSFPAVLVGPGTHRRGMANDGTTPSDRKPSGIPVVIDAWTVQLWADSKISRAAANHLVALVADDLAATSTRLSARLARHARGGVAPRVEVAAR
ncbi:MAG: hypothetical protein ACTHK4_11930 [Mycobacteriales bacterium]